MNKAAEIDFDKLYFKLGFVTNPLKLFFTSQLTSVGHSAKIGTEVNKITTPTLRYQSAGDLINIFYIFK